MTTDVRNQTLQGPDVLYRSLPFNPAVIFHKDDRPKVASFFSCEHPLASRYWLYIDTVLRDRALVITPSSPSRAADCVEYLCKDHPYIGFKLQMPEPAGPFTFYLCGSRNQKLIIVALPLEQFHCQRRFEDVVDVFAGDICLSNSTTKTINYWLRQAHDVASPAEISYLIHHVHRDVCKNPAWLETLERLPA